MKKLNIILFIALIFSFDGNSQDWLKYSDSILANIRRNDNTKAEYFLSLAEKDISGKKIAKDTLFADFLYRRGLVRYFQNKSPEKDFKQSISTWNQSNKVNPKKLMRLYFFLGEYNRTNADLESAYKNYELCYEIGQSIDFDSADLFEGISIYLSKIDFYIHKNQKKATMWARKYVEFKKESAWEERDLDFAKAYSIMGDPQMATEVLIEYLKDYKSNSIGNIDFLFSVYHNLNEYYGDFDSHKEAIKYGELALKLKDEISFYNKSAIESLYSSLIYSYNSIGDNINENKYIRLSKAEFPEEEGEINYSEDLRLLLIDEDYEKFQTLFKQYEIKLIEKKDFNSLFRIYVRSYELCTKGIIFSKNDIEKQVSTIEENFNSLNDENKIYFDVYIADYSFFIQDYLRVLQITNNYLDFQDEYIRLIMYRIKAASELALGINNGNDTADKALELAVALYGEKDPQTLPYLGLVLSVSSKANNNQTTRIATKALEIIYSNSLENTDIAANLWNDLGLEATYKKNYNDGELYFKKSIAIYESYEKISNLYTYYSSHLGLSAIYFHKGNFEESLKYLNKTKSFLDSNPNIMEMAYGDYYYYLGDYYFWQDKFQKAKENYETALEIYGTAMSLGRDLHLIFSDYFLTHNVEATIKRLENYYDKNGAIGNVLKAIYLLKFNTNKSEEAIEILLSNLNKIVQDNNEYFHLLSDNEREIVFKSFTDQFEFLNSHLLYDTDPNFLKDYINYRFYFKSLLFYNSSSGFDQDEKSRTYFNELKENKVLISKYHEQTNSNNYAASINSLEHRNRELEKFLSLSKRVIKTPTFEEVSHNLKEHTAYVEIIRINKQSKSATKDKLNIVNTFTDSIYYGAYIIKKNAAPKFILISESQKFETDYLDHYNKYIYGTNKFKTDSLSYSIYFQQIDQELSDIRSIYLVTDGIYNSINPESFYNIDKKKYVIEYLDIKRIISVRSMFKEKQETSNNELTAILFGNPEFEVDNNSNQANEKFALRNQEIDYFRGNINKTQISYLPGTEREIDTIYNILKNAHYNVDKFTSTDASEYNLKLVESPEILHIATHGFFIKPDKRENLDKSILNLGANRSSSLSYLNSGLLLSGAQNTLKGESSSLNEENGIFTALEARNLDLRNTDLVVLSACETGLGDNLIGEGVYGLQRAFMIAGANSVIMSLWSVNDSTTQRLMHLFYTKRINKGMSIEKAFKEAKLELMLEFPEPFYWAPFILIE